MLCDVIARNTSNPKHKLSQRRFVTPRWRLFVARRLMPTSRAYTAKMNWKGSQRFDYNQMKLVTAGVKHTDCQHIPEGTVDSACVLHLVFICVCAYWMCIPIQCTYAVHSVVLSSVVISRRTGNMGTVRNR